MGPHVWVAGTTATDETGAVIGKDDAYVQAQYIFRKIEKALNEAGCSLSDVVRTRMFLKSIAHSEDVGRAHSEAFNAIRPAATMIEVGGFVSPDMLVEIEVDAVIVDALPS